MPAGRRFQCQRRNGVGGEDLRRWSEYVYTFVSMMSSCDNCPTHAPARCASSRARAMCVRSFFKSGAGVAANQRSNRPFHCAISAAYLPITASICLPTFRFSYPIHRL